MINYQGENTENRSQKSEVRRQWVGLEFDIAISHVDAEFRFSDVGLRIRFHTSYFILHPSYFILQHLLKVFVTLLFVINTREPNFTNHSKLVLPWKILSAFAYEIPARNQTAAWPSVCNFTPGFF
jgi:hypothetical protein